jgi:uncharacterized protein YkvS
VFQARVNWDSITSLLNMVKVGRIREEVPFRSGFVSSIEEFNSNNVVV